MKKKSSIIDTKEEMINNFSKEQLDIYNYYKNKFSDTENSLAVKEDKELIFLEKGCNFLSAFLKVELVVALVIITVIVMVNGFPTESKPQVKYKQTAIVYNENTKI